VSGFLVHEAIVLDNVLFINRLLSAEAKMVKQRARTPTPLVWLTLAVVAALALARPARPAPLAPQPTEATDLARVERVVDGDTVVVNFAGRSTHVRLIGVDAPESVDPRKPVERYDHEAAEFLRGSSRGRPSASSMSPQGPVSIATGARWRTSYRQPDGLLVARVLAADVLHAPAGEDPGDE
jgi:endonuclease YncB( thermonuclease family)